MTDALYRLSPTGFRSIACTGPAAILIARHTYFLFGGAL